MTNRDDLRSSEPWKPVICLQRGVEAVPATCGKHMHMRPWTWRTIACAAGRGCVCERGKRAKNRKRDDGQRHAFVRSTHHGADRVDKVHVDHDMAIDRDCSGLPAVHLRRRPARSVAISEDALCVGAASLARPSAAAQRLA